MAEKKIIFDLDLKTQQANQNVDGILKQLNEVGAVDLSKPFKTFKQELREAQTLVKAVGEKYGETSKEFSLAASKLAELKDKQSELNQTVNSFNPDNKFQALVSLSRGAVGAVQGVASAFTLMGVEGEKANEVVAKLNALAGLADFTNSLDDIQNSYKNLNTVVQSSTVFQKANAVATSVTSMAMKALGISAEVTSVGFKVLKGAIISTGIGALVIGLVALVQNFDSVKKAVLNLLPGLSGVASFFGKVINAVTDFVGVTSEAERATEKLISSTEAQLKKSEEFLDANGYKYDEYTQRKIKANQDYLKKVIEINKDETKSEAEKQALLKQYRDKADFEIDQATADRNRKIAEDNKKILDDEKRKNEEKVNKEKELRDKQKQLAEKAKEDLKKLTKELEDELFNRTATELDKELKKIEEQYKERLMLANGNSDAISLINQARIREEADAFNKYNQPQKIDLNQVKEETKQVTQIKVDGEKLLSNGLAEARKTDVNKLKESKQDELKLFEKNRDGVLQFNSDISDSIGVLSDVVEKNSTEGKALAIADATIKTFNAANTALASAPPPFNFIQMAAVIKAGFTNVKKIISTKLPKGDNVSASSPSLGNLTAPSINPTAFQANGVQNVRVINQDDRIIPAVISDRELQNQQQRKSFLNNLSSF